MFNNQIIKAIFIVLVLGAIGVGYLGVKLSTSSKTTAQKPVEAPAPTFPVLVATKPLPAGTLPTANDVTLVQRTTVPARAIAGLTIVEGRPLALAVQEGQALTEPMFVSKRLANLLMPGERAVGLRIDEVVGLGGFAEPGDHVDVAVYLSPTEETNNKTITMLAIQNARLLAFGNETALDELTPPDPETDGKRKATDKAVDERNKRVNLRSAVVAIPESEVSQLMMASSHGQVRLALRPPPPNTPQAATETLVSITQTAGGAGATPPTQAKTGSQITLGEFVRGDQLKRQPQPKSAPQPRSFEIFDGEHARRQPQS